MTSPPRLPGRLLAQPMYLMLALMRAGHRHAVREGAPIRMTHYAVMAYLEESGPASQKAIAACIGFDKSDVTRIVNDLEAQSLVQRLADDQDSRRHRVTLTPQGRRALQTSDRELGAAMRNFLRGLDAQEYDELQRLLLKAIQVHDPRFIPDEAGAGSQAGMHRRE